MKLFELHGNPINEDDDIMFDFQPSPELEKKLGEYYTRMLADEIIDTTVSAIMEADEVEDGTPKNMPVCEISSVVDDNGVLNIFFDSSFLEGVLSTLSEEDQLKVKNLIDDTTMRTGKIIGENFDKILEII